MNKEIKEEPKKCMYSKDDYTDEDRKALCDGCEEDCKYAKLNTMLDDALTNETKESWNERLDKKDYRERYKRIAQSESFRKTYEGISIGDTVPVEGEISEEPTIPDIVDEHFYEMLGEEPVSEDLEKVVEEIVDPTVLNAYGVKEIANRLRRTMVESANDDLELTWEDIKTIDKLLNQCVDYSNPYQEVLKRFKSYGKKEI